MNGRKNNKKRKEDRRIGIGDQVHICTTELMYPHGGGIPLGTQGIVVDGARLGCFNVQIDNGVATQCIVEVEPRLISRVHNSSMPQSQ